MKDYSGSSLPLVVGSIRGRRFFSFTEDGKLDAPIHHGNPWNVGEEVVARCTWDSVFEVKRKPHTLDECTCGFYASLGEFDSGADENGIPNEYTWAEVVGIIEGYGETLVGERGFRCTKARVLALAPSPGTKADLGWFLRLAIPYIGSKRTYRFRDLKKAFPQVPVFKTAEKMFKAFPVTDLKEFGL